MKKLKTALDYDGTESKPLFLGTEKGIRHRHASRIL